jgi:hypothetical protein
MFRIMKRPYPSTPAAVALLALLVAACGDLDPFGPCAPGEAEECACAGGRASVRVCRFDGLWSSCLCGPGEQSGVDPGALPRDAGAAAQGGGSVALDGGPAPDGGLVAADGGSAADGGRADGGGTIVDAGSISDGGGADAGAARDGGIDAGVRPDAGADGGTVTYRAFAAPAALDRIFIAKADRREDRCTALVLVSPSMGTRYSVTAPAGWAAQSAFMTDRAADCDPPPRTPSGRLVSARDATGVVSFELPPNGRVYPCELDVAVTLRFRPQPSWGPATDDVRAQRLSVEGACP